MKETERLWELVKDGVLQDFLRRAECRGERVVVDGRGKLGMYIIPSVEGLLEVLDRWANCFYRIHKVAPGMFSVGVWLIAGEKTKFYHGEGGTLREALIRVVKEMAGGDAPCSGSAEGRRQVT